MRSIALVLLVASIAHAQWQMQNSHSRAGLRGIHYVGRGVAWASGTGGTVLRTTNGGETWQTCAVPRGGEALDFRAVQAFDASTAIVMSSGTGDLSRLYKTTDGCKSWKVIWTNPDAPNDGFYDALLFITPRIGLVFGDPAHGSMRNPVEGSYYIFRVRVTHDGGETWIPIVSFGKPGENLAPLPNDGIFAASNSSAVVRNGTLWIGTGGSGRVLKRDLYRTPEQMAHAFEASHCAGVVDPFSHSCGIPWSDWHNVSTPLSDESSTSGIFSLAFRTVRIGVAVGGDYKKPDDSARTAAYTFDGGLHWLAPKRAPHGFRSAVAYEKATKAWIAVGPNGTDVSRDDGRTWFALPKREDSPDADQNWNALSLPFVVGPNGRIGRRAALPSSSHAERR
ncbi:MAG TPA: hypothetical protein VFU50_08930 [Terriglobales bacterium]|nr:hypothetical protein [Terriglobales bacterium]